MSVVIPTKSYFPLQPTFFGLTDEYSESLYEQFFFLNYYGSWSFTEAYNLPIKLREWFVKRLSKQKEDEAEAMQADAGSTKQSTTLGPGAPTPKSFTLKE
tara:strand:+ start:198 stop:497 length:300 start_codon:yes stop_codon:yes gene_type:complete